MKKAYSYIRFSSLEQRKGNSLERQIKLREEYVKKNGLVLDTTLSLQDLGVSAFKKRNITDGALGCFLKAVEAGIVEKGSFLLVESLDRISRAEITEQMSLFLNLIRSGITIITLIDGIKYSAETINKQMNDLLYSLMIMSRGHEESLTKSKRLKDSWASKRNKIEKEKVTSIRPAWLDFDKDSGDFVINNDKSRIINLIFEMADQGIGKDRIARRLNEMETATFGRSKFWHQSYIQKILQNRSVIGEFQPHVMKNGKRVPEGLPRPEYFPKVISEELFYRVNEKRKLLVRLVGKARSSNKNLFSGLLFCGYTNATMVLTNKGKWNYLVASNAKVGKKGIKYISWVYKDFEASFFSFVKHINLNDILNPNFKSKSIEFRSLITKIQCEIDVLQRGLTNLINFLIEGKTSIAITEKIHEIENEIETKREGIIELEERLEKFERLEFDCQTSHDETKKMIDLLNEPNARERVKILIRQQIEKIEVFGAGPLKSKFRSSGLESVFFGFPALSEIQIEKLKKNDEEVGEHIRESLNKELTYSEDEDDIFCDSDEYDEIPFEQNLISNNKKELRYFVVNFKTGVKRYVMPSETNPNKIKKAFSLDIQNFDKEGFKLEIG